MDFGLIKNLINEHSPVPLTKEKLNTLCKSAEILCEEGKKHNLTALKTETDIALLHYVDSLSLFTLDEFSEGKKVIDVGCGAGFPALVVGAYNDGLSVCALDSTKKKVDFVSACAKECGITNVNGVCARAEEFPHREEFDICLSRGVARLNVLTELCLPLVKVGGAFIAMKGSAGEEEAEEAKEAIKTCGGKIEKILPVKLPLVDHCHTLIVIRKVENTPSAYPRQYSKIIKRPIGK